MYPSQNLSSLSLLAIKLVIKIKLQHYPVGEMLGLLREERDCVPKELQNTVNMVNSCQGSIYGIGS